MPGITVLPSTTLVDYLGDATYGKDRGMSLMLTNIATLGNLIVKSGGGTWEDVGQITQKLCTLASTETATYEAAQAGDASAVSWIAGQLGIPTDAAETIFGASNYEAGDTTLVSPTIGDYLAMQNGVMFATTQAAGNGGSIV